MDGIFPAGGFDPQEGMLFWGGRTFKSLEFFVLEAIIWGERFAVGRILFSLLTSQTAIRGLFFTRVIRIQVYVCTGMKLSKFRGDFSCVCGLCRDSQFEMPNLSSFNFVLSKVPR